jgi:hypothetical protein
VRSAVTGTSANNDVAKALHTVAAPRPGPRWGVLPIALSARQPWDDVALKWLCVPPAEPRPVGTWMRSCHSSDPVQAGAACSTGEYRAKTRYILLSVHGTPLAVAMYVS